MCLPEHSATQLCHGKALLQLYDMHRELAALEESVKAGEPVEEIRKELEKPKREGFLRGGLFLRRKQHKNTPAPSAEPEGEAQTETAQGVAADAGKSDTGKPDTAAASEENRKEETVSAQDAVRAEEVQDKRQPETDSRKEDDFEPVIPQHDAEEDAAAGEVNHGDGGGVSGRRQGSGAAPGGGGDGWLGLGFRCGG